MEINGQSREFGEAKVKVKDVLSTDGTKIILEDGSWFMIRPSGTEPKVRFYIEARTEEGKKALFSLAERVTREAIQGGI